VSTEKSVLERAKNGDPSAFAEIVNSYEKKIYNLGLKFLHNREDSEDILQETFMAVFKSIKNFRGKSSLSTWIYKIAMNNILMKIRKKGNREFVDMDSYPVDFEKDYTAVSHHIPDQPLEGMIKKELKQKIDNYIDSMPENYKSVFILRDIEEFSRKEVSSILGISVPAVKSNLHRARIYLRDKLGEYIMEKQ